MTRCRSFWPLFHGPEILPYMLKAIWCMNSIIWDYKSVWLKVWPLNKCRSLWPTFHGPVILPYILKTIWYMTTIHWDYESVWPDVWPQNKCRSLWPIFHGPVILPYILKTIWYMNTILWDYESVWPDVWPKNKCRSLWLWPLILPSLYLMDECQTFGKWVSVIQSSDLCFFLMFALKNILVLLAKQDSGELRCPATALILSLALLFVLRFFQYCLALWLPRLG